MGYSVAEYAKMVLSLFPRGKAWSRDTDGNLYKLSLSHAEELSRINIENDKLLIERDTRKTSNLLVDHERDLGLPDECASADQTVSRRRLAAHAKLVTEGGMHSQAYIDLAADLGFTIEIEEISPCWCGMAACGDPIGDQPNIFYWKVLVYSGDQTDWTYFTSGGSSSGDQIISATGTLELQCTLNKYKPAHTQIIWDYYGPAFSNAFSNAFDAVPANDPASFDGAFDRAFDSSFDQYLGGGDFDKDAFDDSFYKPL